MSCRHTLCVICQFMSSHVTSSHIRPYHVRSSQITRGFPYHDKHLPCPHITYVLLRHVMSTFSRSAKKSRVVNPAVAFFFVLVYYLVSLAFWWLLWLLLFGFLRFVCSQLHSSRTPGLLRLLRRILLTVADHADGALDAADDADFNVADDQILELLKLLVTLLLIVMMLMSPSASLSS